MHYATQEMTPSIRDHRQIAARSPVADCIPAELAAGRARRRFSPRVHHLDISRFASRSVRGAVFEIDLSSQPRWPAARTVSSTGLLTRSTHGIRSLRPLCYECSLIAQYEPGYMAAAAAPQADASRGTPRVVSAASFRTLRDSEGKTPSDHRPHRDAKVAAHPWIGAVYKATSGWVHLSPAHLWTTAVGDGPLTTQT